MWAFLRVVIFEWILARLGLRWLISLLIAVPLALVFFVGIPTLLVVGVVIFMLWRFLRRPAPPDPVKAAEAPPA
jgi:hypothetical protein